MHYSKAHLSIYRMRDAPTFVLKGDVPLVTHVSLYLRNQRHIIGMRVYLLSHKWDVSDINLTEMHRKANQSPFYPHWARSAPRWYGHVSFFPYWRWSPLRASPIYASYLSFLCCDLLFCVGNSTPGELGLETMISEISGGGYLYRALKGLHFREVW
jgi:hypothetical protein